MDKVYVQDDGSLEYLSLNYKLTLTRKVAVLFLMVICANMGSS